jgi:hypothetical protein
MNDLAGTLATLTAAGAIAVPTVQLLMAVTKTVLSDDFPSKYYPAIAIAWGMVFTFALALVAGAQGSELAGAIVAGFLGGLAASQQFRSSKAEVVRQDQEAR